MLSSKFLGLALLAGVSAIPAAPKPPSGSGAGSSTCTINWNGTTLTGATDGNACRYTVRYGQAARWDYSVPATNQANQNAAQFPPMCPQKSFDSLPSAVTPRPAHSEDCLYMTVYTPKGATSTSALPVLFWVPGGSYVGGSVSDSGLSGSAIAAKDNIIVVFVQHRLGLLGLLPPALAPTSPDPNFALRDVILALRMVRDNVAAIGGDKTKVTVGGQSSGASMVRALWTAPCATGLFRGAILQSDTMMFGMQSPSDTAQIRDFVYGASQFNACTNLACYKSTSVANILAAQDWATLRIPALFPVAPPSLPFRPQFGTVTLPIDPTNALFNNPAKLTLNVPQVPLLLTTVHNEGGTAVNLQFPVNPTTGNSSFYGLALTNFIGDVAQAGVVYNSGFYPYQNVTDGLRLSMEKFVTDAAWRCPVRAVASKYASRGGKVWVGEWTNGIHYPINAAGYCNKADVVCHSDDIFATFQSTSGVSAEQTAFENLVANYWSSFITHGDPTAGGQAWTPWTATSSTSAVKNLGDKSAVPDCPANFYGTAFPYKWATDSSQPVANLGAGVSASNAVCLRA